MLRPATGRGYARAGPRRGAPTTTTRLGRLGLLDTTNLVIGAIIGVGIFFTPAAVARIAGSEGTALLLWAIGGLCAGLGAWTFAELGRLSPRVGGHYEVIRDSWGALAAFIWVVCHLTAVQPGAIAIIAWICADNLVVLVAPGTAAPRMPVAALLVVAVTAANALGLRHGARLQNLTVAGRLVALTGVILAGAWVFVSGEPVRPGPGVTAHGESGLGVLAGLLPAMFAYGGWQQALWMRAEVEDPGRTLPPAILGGVGVVVAAYLGTCWAYFRLIGFDGVADGGPLAAEAIGAVLPDVGARVAAGAVFVSALGVLNAQLLAGPRLAWAMADDGRFFRAVAQVHPTTGTPVVAILLSGSLGLGLLLAAGIDGADRLTAWTVVIDAVFFALTAAALVRLLWAEGLRGPAALAIPIGFGTIELAAVAGALASVEVQAAAVAGILWVAAAALVYLVGFRRP